MGSLRLTLDGRPLGDFALLALQDVEVTGIMGRIWDSLRLLLK
jgi:hypothetical protein